MNKYSANFHVSWLAGKYGIARTEVSLETVAAHAAILSELKATDPSSVNGDVYDAAMRKKNIVVLNKLG